MKYKLNDRIRLIRLKEGLKQEDFAKKLNVNLDTISRYEKAYRTPDAVFLNKLISEFGCNAGWLTSGRGWMEYPQDTKIPCKWIKGLVEKNKIHKVVILQYYDDSYKKINGLLIETKNGVLSINRLPLGYSLIETNYYKDIITTFKNKGIHIGFFAEDKGTTEFNSIDLSLYISKATYSDNIVADVIKSIENVSSLPFKGIDEKILRDPTLISLIDKLKFVYASGETKQRAEIRGLIEELYDQISKNLGQSKG